MTAVEDPLVQALGFVAAFAATFAAAAIGSRATIASVNTWYAGLRKPSWVPSGRAIGLIWSVLYVLMALAALWAVTMWAGLLFVPYLAWVTFAGNLNRIVVRMNPAAG